MTAPHFLPLKANWMLQHPFPYIDFSLDPFMGNKEILHSMCSQLVVQTAEARGPPRNNIFKRWPELVTIYIHCIPVQEFAEMVIIYILVYQYRSLLKKINKIPVT